MKLPRRLSIISAQVSVCTAADALDLLEHRLHEGGGGYVCFTNAHAAVMCCEEARFCDVTAGSLLSLADGKSIYWAARFSTPEVGHVPGPDFLLKTLQRFPDRRHFFYGSTPATLSALVQHLASLVPGLTICGQIAPPFRVFSAEETQANLRAISDARPDFVWVGLGAPKQELWMAASFESLRPAVLFGVGAAFDFHAGTLRRAPAIMRYVGLEWLYRLLQEPRRLWRRYLVTNSMFLYYLLRDSRGRRRTVPPRPSDQN